MGAQTTVRIMDRLITLASTKTTLRGSHFLGFAEGLACFDDVVAVSLGGVLTAGVHVSGWDRAASLCMQLSSYRTGMQLAKTPYGASMRVSEPCWCTGYQVTDLLIGADCR